MDLRSRGWTDLAVRSRRFHFSAMEYIGDEGVLTRFFAAPKLDFWRAKNAWLPTWPTDIDRRSMVV